MGQELKMVIERLEQYVQSDVLSERLQLSFIQYIYILKEESLTQEEFNSLLKIINNHEEELQLCFDKYSQRLRSFVHSTEMSESNKSKLNGYIEILENKNSFSDEKLAAYKLAIDMKNKITQKQHQLRIVKRAAYMIANEEIDNKIKVQLQEKMTEILNPSISDKIKEVYTQSLEEQLEIIHWQTTAEKLRGFMDIKNIPEKDLIDLEFFSTLLKTDLISPKSKRIIMPQAIEKLKYCNDYYSPKKKR